MAKQRSVEERWEMLQWAVTRLDLEMHEIRLGTNRLKENIAQARRDLAWLRKNMKESKR